MNTIISIRRVIKGLAWAFIVLGIIAYPALYALTCLRQCVGGYLGENILAALIVTIPFLIIGGSLLLFVSAKKLIFRTILFSVAIIILLSFIYFFYYIVIVGSDLA